MNMGNHRNIWEPVDMEVFRLGTSPNSATVSKDRESQGFLARKMLQVQGEVSRCVERGSELQPVQMSRAFMASS